MAETVRGTHKRRWWVGAAVAAAAALVLGGAMTIQLLRENTDCSCVNPDAGLDVAYAMVGPDGDTVQARLEVVEVAAVDGYTRTVLHFSNSDEQAAAFDPAYFLGGAGPGDGFRVWDPATGRLYENQSALGTVTGDDQVWEPRTRYEIVLFSAPLEPGTEEVEVRGPHGEIRIPNVHVRGGAADTDPLWTPQDAQATEGTEEEEAPETVPLHFTAPAPGDGVPGYAEAFAPSTPDPVDPVPAAAETDEEGWARSEEGGRTWRMSVGSYVVEDGVLTFKYRLEVEGEDVPSPERLPDLFPDGFVLMDPATGDVVPEQRVGEPDGESEPLWSVAWPRLRDNTPRTFGELAFAAPSGEARELLLDAGAFGALPVSPRV
ncbi:hypothetical protein ACFXKD_03390 [Nocardiopsis aegyptia]|uniref:hypothetical protein n=1 Tax=Nocardiopsis aegyptia TaxID=220378 RepID=UPI0036730E4F